MSKFFKVYVFLLCKILVAQSYLHGRVVVHSGSHFFQYEDGTPFFYLGDTDWELFHRCSREEAHELIKNRAAKGFTVLQAVILAELDGIHSPNVYGHRPFLNNDPSTPNEDYFRHVDYIINLADAYGLQVALLPTWGDKITPNMGAGPVIFDNIEVSYKYGEFLGKRYRNKKNIIWMLGGDRNWEGYEPIWRAMAKGITVGVAGMEDYTKTTMTLHSYGGTTSSHLFHNEPWLDFNTWQTGHCYTVPSYDNIYSDYLKYPPKPVIDGEPLYEEMPICFELKNNYSVDFHVRRFLYHDLFSGAAGHTYGCNSIWQMYTPNRAPLLHPGRSWKESLNLPGAFQMQYARNLLESRPYFSRLPDQTLIVSDIGYANDRITSTRDSGGTYAFVYSEQGRSFALDLKKLNAKTLRSFWYDPRTGTSQLDEIFENPGIKTFYPPTAGLGNDWVLVVDDASKNYPFPSKAYISGTKPQSPVNVKTHNVKPDLIEIHWNRTVPHSAYAVYLNGNFYGATTDTTFLIYELNSDTPYRVSVKGFVAGKESEAGKELTIRTSKAIHATRIITDNNVVTLKAGNTFALKAQYFPANATYKNVVWESADSNIVSVRSDEKVAFAKRTGKTALKAIKLPEKLSVTTMIDVILPDDFLSVEKTDSKIILDGEFTEKFWKIEHSLNKHAFGRSDNQIKFGVAYSDKYLYVGVQVFDNHLVNDGGEAYQNDAIEVFIDGNFDRLSGLRNVADRQFIVGIDGELVEQMNRTKGVKSVLNYQDNRYSLEMAIPFETLKINPVPGTFIGFDIAVSDDDEGGNRQHLMVWKGGTDNWINTSNYGKLLLK